MKIGTVTLIPYGSILTLLSPGSLFIVQLFLTLGIEYPLSSVSFVVQ